LVQLALAMLVVVQQVLVVPGFPAEAATGQ